MNKSLYEIILSAVSLAMGIAVFVLGILNKLNVNNGMSMVSIAIICLALMQFKRK